MSSASNVRAGALLLGTVAIAVAATVAHEQRGRAVAPPHVIALPVVEAAEPTVHAASELWVCADPNNLPFSNQQQEGFENQIAALVAGELGQTLRYFWLPQRRGFVRNSLRAGECDLIVGVPSGYDPVATTVPYYRSSFVFVTRPGEPRLQSFDDGRLGRLRIGIQVTGDDYENPPPAAALARRHVASQIRGYPVYGDYSTPSPQRAVIAAVADGTIDTAVVWGPTAGYFAALEPRPLIVSPVHSPSPSEERGFTFEIAMGVRRGDTERLDAINRAIGRRRRDIEQILRAFHVPVLKPLTASRAASPQDGDS